MMTKIYFRDGGVYDPGTGQSVTSVYAIDTDQVSPTGKIALPPSGAFGPQAVSYDGAVYVQTRDLGENSAASFLNFQLNSQHSVPYNLNGGQSKGAGFAQDGRLVIGSGAGIAIIAPPYTAAVERDLPVTINGFAIFPGGDRVLLIQESGMAYIADLATLATGDAIDLLQDEASEIASTTVQISPDGSKFLIVSKYGISYAAGVFNAVTGDFIGRTGFMPRRTEAFFLADSNRIAYADESEYAINVFDLETSAETPISTMALPDDPVIQGVTADGYAIVNLRRLSLADGSVPTTPGESEETGEVIVQPISIQSGGQVLKYFWTDFVKSYENPVVVSG